ncbi:MAG: 50S ribosomal protein L23 [Elusimicrobia bacterium]|jgi:large subunit ribosomal protein L23|nr:50S ribosomal protein L23 [Elusimicrobiota bacterium]MBK7207301.1 50S ribosomal protein L23 [Elusimicrobiota bacterium]MBK7546114.1 50S ribosomal protein L23 [Elusimicrobiota bacterium]MBK7575461.1 50S ribosomal protein L23 [Elusimicrobiota bacterium]MBK7689173.1 50S ribosomal protein L23 [Elusimicrobiota bacterium]
MGLATTQVLFRPVLTERSTLLREQNKYIFEVAPRATKGQIKDAVQTVFKVKVTAVNTMNMPGKLRRRGAHAGYQSDWKKAIVTLKQGQEIKHAEPQA